MNIRCSLLLCTSLHITLWQLLVNYFAAGGFALPLLKLQIMTIVRRITARQSKGWSLYCAARREGISVKYVAPHPCKGFRVYELSMRNLSCLARLAEEFNLEEGKLRDRDWNFNPQSLVAASPALSGVGEDKRGAEERKKACVEKWQKSEAYRQREQREFVPLAEVTQQYLPMPRPCMVSEVERVETVLLWCTDIEGRIVKARPHSLNTLWLCDRTFRAEFRRVLNAIAEVDVWELAQILMPSCTIRLRDTWEFWQGRRRNVSAP